MSEYILEPIKNTGSKYILEPIKKAKTPVMPKTKPAEIDMNDVAQYWDTPSPKVEFKSKPKPKPETIDIQSHQRSPVSYAFESTLGVIPHLFNAYNTARANTMSKENKTWYNPTGEDISKLPKEWKKAYNKEFAFLNDTSKDTAPSGSSALANKKSEILDIQNPYIAGAENFMTGTQADLGSVIVDPANVIPVDVIADVGKATKAVKAVKAIKKAGFKGAEVVRVKKMLKTDIIELIDKIPETYHAEFIQDLVNNADAIADRLISMGVKPKIAQNLASKAISKQPLNKAERVALTALRIADNPEMPVFPKSPTEQYAEDAWKYLQESKNEIPQGKTRSGSPVILGEQKTTPSKVILPEEVLTVENELLRRTNIEPSAVNDFDKRMLRQALDKVKNGKLLNSQERAIIDQYTGTFKDIPVEGASRQTDFPINKMAGMDVKINKVNDMPQELKVTNNVLPEPVKIIGKNVFFNISDKKALEDAGFVFKTSANKKNVFIDKSQWNKYKENVISETESLPIPEMSDNLPEIEIPKNIIPESLQSGAVIKPSKPLDLSLGDNIPPVANEGLSGAVSEPKITNAEVTFNPQEQAVLNVVIDKTQNLEPGSTVMFKNTSEGKVRNILPDGVEVEMPDGNIIKLSHEGFNKEAFHVSPAKTIEMNAGIGTVIPKDVSENILQKMVGFVKRHLSITGNTDDLFKAKSIATRDDLPLARLEAEETGLRMVQNKLTNEKYARELQQVESDILEGIIKTPEELAEKTKVPLPIAKQVFKDTREAADAMETLGKNLVDHGVLDEEVFRIHQGEYNPRMYRYYEYKGIMETRLREISQNLRASKNPEDIKWANIAETLADKTRYDKVVQKFQKQVEELGDDAFSEVGGNNFIKLDGEQWLVRNGQYIRRDIYKEFSEMNEIINAAQKFKGKTFRQTTDEIAKGMDLSYLKRRKDLPEAYRKLLGEITEPAYPVAKRLAQMGMDVVKYDFYEFTANHIKEMGLLKPGTKVHKFDGKKWGKLDGVVVPEEYARVIRNFADEYEHQRNIVDKVMDGIKEGFTIWNPATHARNTASNIILTNIIYSPNPVEYVKSLGNFIRKDASFEIAKRSTLFKGNFNEDLGYLLDQFEAIERDPDAIKNVVAFLGNIRKNVHKAYNFEDNFFKLVAFKHELKKTGVEIDAVAERWPSMSRPEQLRWIRENGLKAAKEAKDAIPTYDRIPKFARTISRYWEPFLSFQWAFTTRTIPKILRHSTASKIRATAALLGLYGLNTAFQAKKEDLYSMPSYMRNQAIDWMYKENYINENTWTALQKGTNGFIKMPFNDKYGRQLYLDTNYLLPWQQYVNAKGGKNSWMNFAFKQPLLRVAAEIGMNQNFFTGQKGVARLSADTWTNQAKQSLGYAFQSLTSPMIGGRSYQKIKSAVKGEEDKKGRVRDINLVLLDTLLGIKLTPADPEQAGISAEYDADMQMAEIDKKIREKMSYAERGIIKPEKAKAEIDRLLWLKDKRIAEFQKLSPNQAITQQKTKTAKKSGW